MSKWIWLIFSIFAIYGIYFSVSYFSDSDIECFSESVCFESPGQSWAIAGLRTLTWVLAIGAAILTFRFLGWIAAKGWLFTFGGIFMIAIWVFVNIVFFLVTEPGERMELLHIPILSSVIGIFGAVIFISAVRKKGE